MDIDEYLEKGYLQVNVLFEIIGSPKEHVEQTINKILETVEKEKGIEVIEKDTAEVEDSGEGMFSCFSEVELLAKDLEKITWIAFNFTPASIEIIEPGKISLKDTDMTAFMGDLLAKLHDVSSKNVAISNQNLGLQRNLNAVIRNCILALLVSSDKSDEELANLLGMNKEDVGRIVGLMIKEGTVIQKEDKYSRK